MRSSTVFLSFLFSVAIVLAEPTGLVMPDIGCGHAFWQNLTSEPPTYALQRRGFAPIPDVGSHIKVYWEVISADQTTKGGYVTDDQIHRQIDVLNKDFVPVGLSFELVHIQRVINPSWARLNRGENRIAEAAMKSTMPMKDPAMLRVYSNINPKDEGWTWVLDWGRPPPRFDGIVLAADFLPSDNHPGHELTHEVGHWSGLGHTFDNGCNSPGDFVPDTPPQLNATWQCNQPRTSCPGGLPDAADNHMNYVPDQCRSQFTPGQIERMRTRLKQYRGITIRAPSQSVGAPTPFRPTTPSTTRPTWFRRPFTQWRPSTTFRRPDTRPSAPNRRPSTPSTRPSTPAKRPSTPNTRPSTPSPRPTPPHRPDRTRPASKPTRWQPGQTKLVPLAPGTGVGPGDRVRCWGNTCYLVVPVKANAD